MECTNRELLGRLRRFIDGKSDQWVRQLGRAMLAVNLRVIASVQCSPFKALMGYTPKRVHEVAVAVPVHPVKMMMEGWKQLEEGDLHRRIDGR